MKDCRQLQKAHREKEKENEQLADKPILIDRLALLPVGQLGDLAPHLLDVLQDHVHVSVEGLDTREHLAAAAQRDEDLRVRAHRGLEDRQGACRELVLLEHGDFVLTVCLAGWLDICFCV